jgi:hypothetical protein
LFSFQFDFLSLTSAKIGRISLETRELAQFFTPQLRLKKTPGSKATPSRLKFTNKFSVYLSLALPLGQRNETKQLFNREPDPVRIKPFNSPGQVGEHVEPQPWVWMDGVGKSAGVGS